MSNSPWPACAAAPVVAPPEREGIATLIATGPVVEEAIAGRPTGHTAPVVAPPEREGIATLIDTGPVVEEAIAGGATDHTAPVVTPPEREGIAPLIEAGPVVEEAIPNPRRGQARCENQAGGHYARCEQKSNH